MIRLMSLSAMLVVLLTLSLSVHAQGKRPDGAGSGVGNRPAAGQQRDMSDMRERADMRRQEAEMRRQKAEMRRQEADAEARRAAGEEHNQSEQARIDHPPNSNAAVEAIQAEANADNQYERDDRRGLAGENRGEHGGDDPDGDDDD